MVQYCAQPQPLTIWVGELVDLGLFIRLFLIEELLTFFMRWMILLSFFLHWKLSQMYLG